MICQSCCLAVFPILPDKQFSVTQKFSKSSIQFETDLRQGGLIMPRYSSDSESLPIRPDFTHHPFQTLGNLNLQATIINYPNQFVLKGQVGFSSYTGMIKQAFKKPKQRKSDLPNQLEKHQLPMDGRPLMLRDLSLGLLPENHSSVPFSAWS